MKIPVDKIGYKGTVGWESPSNIALVKYWGKHGRQLPRNASISFTLQNAKSITRCSYEILEELSDAIDLSFEFEGRPNEAFAQKIQKFLNSVLDLYPYLPQIKFSIQSENTFPHSTGIASSASAMSALSMCITSIHEQLFGANQDSLVSSSRLSRLGSGSASRSVFPQLAVWGKHPQVEGSSDEYAIGYGHKVDPIFHTFHDDILIVSDVEKSVSSTAGHALMEGNPYAQTRYANANDNLARLLEAMKKGDLTTFIEIVESEALTLHALMMCSTPSYILMRPHTLTIIEEIRAYRTKTGVPVCFTLDAGPNIHLLYPDKAKEKVKAFIESRLKKYTLNENYILADQVGNGPKLL